MKKWFGIVCCAVALSVQGAGEPPYERVRAGRLQDDHPALIPFTGADGWRVETQDAAARFERSDEVLLFGDGVAKLTYRATGPHPRVTLLPPAPVAITSAFDAVTCWIYGNNHNYAPRSDTPPVSVTLRFTDSAGARLSVPLARVHFKEWFLCHRRLVPEQIARAANGATLVAIDITNGHNTEDRVIYFNSLAVFTERFEPLTFAPRPRRGVQVFPACDPGANIGSTTLPFPNTPLTVVPRDPVPSVARVGRNESGRYHLVREGKDGRLEFRLPAQLGAWDDMAVRWGDGAWANIGLEGGLYFAPTVPTGTLARAESETMTVTTDGKSVTYAGRLTQGGRSIEAEIRFQLVGKSLVMDIQAGQGEIGEVRFGATRGFVNPRLATLPYYTYGFTDGGMVRPAVVISGELDAPLFFMAHIDWTQSNASFPFAKNMRFDGALSSNGGTRYTPKTDGQRNPCFERFVMTLSPRFEDVLPNIPNPPSPWKSVTGTRVWRAHGAGNRANDATYWRNVHRWA